MCVITYVHYVDLGVRNINFHNIRAGIFMIFPFLPFMIHDFFPYLDRTELGK